MAKREAMALGTPPLAGEGPGERSGPVVLVDMGDNIGGGSAGDSTFLLAELLAQGAPGWVMTLADPAAVKPSAEAVRSGLPQQNPFVCSHRAAF